MLSQKPREKERRTNPNRPVRTISDVITHCPEWVGLIESAPIEHCKPQNEWQRLPWTAQYRDTGR
jgi:hypothetical protein